MRVYDRFADEYIDEMEKDPIAPPERYIELSEELILQNAARWFCQALGDDSAEKELVRVVRCKDCKYKRLYDEGETKYYYCALEDRPNRNWSVDDTDYCSWGERREDGEA